MFTLSPVTLTLNTASLLDFNQNQATVPTQAIAPDQVLAVKVTNESPYALLVTGPGTDQRTWLAPWTEDVYFPGQSPTTHLSLLPQSLPGGVALPGSPQSSAALIAVYVVGDPVPHGQWPMALSRQLAVGNQLNTITQAQWHTITHGVPSGPLTITVPAPTNGQTLYLVGIDFTSQIPANGGFIELLILQMTGMAVSTFLQWYQYATSTIGVSFLKNFTTPIPAIAPNTAIIFSQVNNASMPQDALVYAYQA